MHEELLENIGLTKGEVKVYLTLLQIGETTTGKIIEKSGLSGGKIYLILDRLCQKGLVTYIVKEKTKYFQAATPKKILEFIDETKSKIDKKKKAVEDILPQLMGLHNLKTKESSAVIYKGIQGFKTVLSDTLDRLTKDDEWLAFGVRGDRPVNVKRVWDKWLKERVRKKIKSKMIVADKAAYDGYKSVSLTDFKMLKLESTAPITISRDVVLIYDWKELSIIKITNEDIAHSFREFFYSLWNIAEKIK
ncbi:hypothetical protein HQ545_00350 [Candidatus Woesearchaeota archaeon]|nr:hypothetical protein [Candidatus Woesearchaeota archaeon]